MRRISIIKWLIRFGIIALGLILGYIIQPNVIQPYVGSVLSGSNQILAEGQHIEYIDVEGDSISEEFIYYHLSDNRQPIVNQYSATGDFQFVWYLEGEVVENFEFISGDYNHDSINEVFVFSFNKNQLCLYGLASGTKSYFIVKGLPVYSFAQPVSTDQIVIHSVGISDLNHDGFGEVIFSVNSRFVESPHKVFAYDISNDTLYESPEIGLQLVGSPILFDVDNDGTPEIFLSTLNSTNQAWIPKRSQMYGSASVVLRPDLTYYYLPLMFENRMSVTSTFPLVQNGTNYMASVSWLIDRESSSDLVLMDSKGRVVKSKKINENNFVFDSKRTDWSTIQLFGRKGYIANYDTALTLNNKVELNDNINQGNYIDVDFDGEEELVVVQNNQLTILRKDFSEPVVYNIPGLNVQKVLFSVKRDPINGHKLSIQNNNQQFLISYSKNRYYRAYLLVYPAIVFILYGIYSLIIWFHNNAVHRIKVENEKIFELRLDLIRNQFDPHFLFNALNSIGFSINKDERKTAYYNLGLFSKFLRESIVSLEEFSRTLEEEIEYTVNYLSLEKFRFKDKFDYNFIVAPGVSKSQKVPKLILFSFVESALKKGVLPIDSSGFITITIDKFEEQSLFISITDDGLHRNIEHSNETFTKNMLMILQVAALFNRNNPKPIDIKLKDLGTPVLPRGSNIEITIPADYQYHF